MYIGNKQHDLITIAAAFTSFVIGEGDICLPMQMLKTKIINLEKKLLLKNIISNFTGPVKLWNQIFFKSNSVSNGNIITPLILSNNCLYLYKTWKAEQTILNFLYQENNIDLKNAKKYQKIINDLFDLNEQNFQKIAVSMSIIQKKLFIIGGPGTGKTSIISKIIIALIKTNKKKIKIKLAAPTGQATSNLKKILNNTLYKNNLLSNSEKIKCNVMTIHKLLGIFPNNSKAKFNEKNVLDLDVLIIDESSMIDLFIMEQLIYALPKKARIIFFGDINQIPPVGNGNILKDICYIAKNQFNKISKLLTIITNNKINNNNYSNFINDYVCILNKNYRFKNNSSIHKLSISLMNEDKKIFLKLKNNYFKNITINSINSKKKYLIMLHTIVKKYSIYWEKVFNKSPIQEIINTFQKYRLIGAIRSGIFGINEINKNLEKIMQKQGFIKFHIMNSYKEYLGKPIVISENNKTLGLLNGDIGIMLFHKNQIKAFFLSYNNKIKKIPINILPKHETAWAMTIHKSQGSEFLHTTLILPNEMNSILTKELLYTAITRSKEKLSIYSKKNIFLQSMKKTTNRVSQINNEILLH